MVYLLSQSKDWRYVTALIDLVTIDFAPIESSSMIDRENSKIPKLLFEFTEKP